MNTKAPNTCILIENPIFYKFRFRIAKKKTADSSNWQNYNVNNCLFIGSNALCNKYFSVWSLINIGNQLQNSRIIVNDEQHALPTSIVVYVNLK